MIINFLVVKNSPPLERLDFPTLVDRLSERLSFGDREKMSIFVRGMVATVLEAVEIKARKKFTPDEIQFSMSDSNRKLGTMVRLDIVENGGKSEEPKAICSVLIREGNYRGLPDGATMGKDPSEKVEMVPRKRISAVEFKPATQNVWLSVFQVLKGQKREGAHCLQMDVQVKS